MEQLQKIETRKDELIITKKEIEEYLFTSDTKLNEKQKTMFIKLAQLHNLNPFKREIYAIPFGKEFSIVTGYQIYIQRAEATGDLDGWNVESNDETAKITIWRKSFSHPFIWEVDKSDFGKSYGSWRTMPKFMLKKVAIGQGFRLAFPNELGSMLYLKEEMEDAEPYGTKVIPDNKETITNRNYTEEASQCKTIDELKNWFNSLNSEEKKAANGVKNNRKDEILTAPKGVIQTPKEEEPETTIIIDEMLKNAKTKDNLLVIDKIIDKLESGEEKRDYIDKLAKKITELNFDYEINSLPF